MTNRSPSVFLTAEWRHLAMANYEIDPQILQPLVPAGTELDFWNGKAFVSVVGFLFQQTRVRGIAFPLHQNFEEINLRFYVRRRAADGWRRAVVFIREIVPRRAIAWLARALYNEPYLALPTSHQVTIPTAETESAGNVAYLWRFRGRDNFLKMRVRGQARPLLQNSEPEFITEHYWGYTRQRDGSTLEYQVEHPRWQFWEAETAELHCDVAALYGDIFQDTLHRRPSSVFLATGSEVKVHQGVRITV